MDFLTFLILDFPRFIWLNYHVLCMVSFFFVVAWIKNHIYLSTSLWSKHVSTFLQRFPLFRKCCSMILQNFEVLPWHISFSFFSLSLLLAALLAGFSCDATVPCWVILFVIVELFSCFDCLEQLCHCCSMTDFAKTDGNHLMRQCHRNTWFSSRHIVNYFSWVLINIIKIVKEDFLISHSQLKLLRKDWMILNDSFPNLVLYL